MTETIICRYYCSRCKQKRDVPVATRTEEQNVVEWLEQVAVVAISEDHARVSPRCRATHMDEVYIPVDHRPRVGGPVQH
jgi:hypothetical protein